MKKYRKEDIDFTETELFEFKVNKYFSIYYEEGLWFAESIHPDIDDDLIIIEGIYEEIGYQFKDQIELFDDFILTREKFNELKEFVNKELN